MKTEKTLFLLPHRFQIFGIILACFSFFFLLISLFMGLDSSVLVRCQIYGLLVLYIGLLIIGSSREKHEDEFTIYLRAKSALSALLYVFLLKIILTLFTSILQFKGTLPSSLKELINAVTGLGFVFVVYLFLFKSQLSRYNKESKKQEDYEE